MIDRCFAGLFSHGLILFTEGSVHDRCRSDRWAVSGLYGGHVSGSQRERW